MFLEIYTFASHSPSAFMYSSKFSVFTRFHFPTNLDMMRLDATGDQEQCSLTAGPALGLVTCDTRSGLCDKFSSLRV